MPGNNWLHKNIYIKENALIAQVAAAKLGSSSAAIVIGNTIYLYNCTKQEFLANDRWVKHELCHVKQFREHGFMSFVLKYLWESVLHGYYHNKYEAEARAAEEL